MEKVDKEHIEKMRILQIIRKNALNMNWKCMVDGCPEKLLILIFCSAMVFWII